MRGHSAKLASILFTAAVTTVLWAGPANAAKVVVLLSYATPDADMSEGVNRGVRTAMGPTSTLTSVPTGDSTKQTDTYPASNGVTVEVRKVCVGQASCIDAYKAAFIAASNDSSVIGIVCLTSAQCLNASNASSATNVTVVAAEATSSRLKTIANIVRIAPSNQFMSMAMYNALKNDNVTRLAIIYEPNVYGADLETWLMAYAIQGEALGTQILGADGTVATVSVPHLQGVFSVYPATLTSVSRLQMATGAQTVDNLASLGTPDAVVYLGFTTGFSSVFAAATAKGLNAVKWYVSDGVFDTPALAIAGIGSANLKAFSAVGRTKGSAAATTFETAYDTLYGTGDTLYRPLVHVDYGYDTGKFLNAVITEAASSGGTTRANFYKVAMSPRSVEGLTGVKPSVDSVGGKFSTYTISSGKWSLGATVTADARGVK